MYQNVLVAKVSLLRFHFTRPEGNEVVMNTVKYFKDRIFFRLLE